MSSTRLSDEISVVSVQDATDIMTVKMDERYALIQMVHIPLDAATKTINDTDIMFNVKQLADPAAERPNDSTLAPGSASKLVRIDAKSTIRHPVTGIVMPREKATYSGAKTHTKKFSCSLWGPYLQPYMYNHYVGFIYDYRECRFSGYNSDRVFIYHRNAFTYRKFWLLGQKGYDAKQVPSNGYSDDDFICSEKSIDDLKAKVAKQESQIIAGSLSGPLPHTEIKIRAHKDALVGVFATYNTEYYRLAAYAIKVKYIYYQLNIDCPVFVIDQNEIQAGHKALPVEIDDATLEKDMLSAVDNCITAPANFNFAMDIAPYLFFNRPRLWESLAENGKCPVYSTFSFHGALYDKNFKEIATHLHHKDADFNAVTRFLQSRPSVNAEKFMSQLSGHCSFDVNLALLEKVTPQLAKGLPPVNFRLKSLQKQYLAYLNKNNFPLALDMLRKYSKLDQNTLALESPNEFRFIHRILYLQCFPKQEEMVIELCEKHNADLSHSPEDKIYGILGPLNLAVKFRLCNIAEYFLSKHSNAFTPRDKGAALLSAIDVDIKLASKILALPNVDYSYCIKESNENTLLHEAAVCDFDFCQAVRRKTNFVDRENKNEETALAYAIKFLNCDPRVIDALLDKDACRYYKPQQLYKALKNALRCPVESQAKLLVKKILASGHRVISDTEPSSVLMLAAEDKSLTAEFESFIDDKRSVSTYPERELQNVFIRLIENKKYDLAIKLHANTGLNLPKKYLKNGDTSLNLILREAPIALANLYYKLSPTSFQSAKGPVKVLLERAHNSPPHKELLKKLIMALRFSSEELNIGVMMTVVLLRDTALAARLLTDNSKYATKLSPVSWKGTTALHAAVTASPDMKFIPLLCKASDPRLLSMENSRGETALSLSAQLYTNAVAACLLSTPNFCQQYSTEQLAKALNIANVLGNNATAQTILQHGADAIIPGITTESILEYAAKDDKFEKIFSNFLEDKHALQKYESSRRGNIYSTLIERKKYELASKLLLQANVTLTEKQANQIGTHFEKINRNDLALALLETENDSSMPSCSFLTNLASRLPASTFSRDVLTTFFSKHQQTSFASLAAGDALFYFLLKQQYDLALMLLQANISLHCNNGDIATTGFRLALDLALKGQPTILDEILKKQCNLNEIVRGQKSAMHIVVEHDRVDLAKAFLNYKQPGFPSLNLFLKDDNVKGEIPLVRAIESGNREMIDLLFEPSIQQLKTTFITYKTEMSAILNTYIQRPNPNPKWVQSLCANGANANVSLVSTYKEKNHNLAVYCMLLPFVDEKEIDSTVLGNVIDMSLNNPLRGDYRICQRLALEKAISVIESGIIIKSHVESSQRIVRVHLAKTSEEKRNCATNYVRQFVEQSRSVLEVSQIRDLLQHDRPINNFLKYSIDTPGVELERFINARIQDLTKLQEKQATSTRAIAGTINLSNAPSANAVVPTQTTHAVVAAMPARAASVLHVSVTAGNQRLG